CTFSCKMFAVFVFINYYSAHLNTTLNFDNTSYTMKYLISFLFVFTFCNCTENKVYEKAENALDAGREFIDGCLKADFDKATFYMVSDSTNKNMLLTLKR